MRVPSVSLLLVALLVGAVGTSCGDDPPVEVSPSATGGSESSEPNGTGGSGGTSGAGGLAECGEILRAYGNLAATALQGQDAAAAAQDTLDGLSSDLPQDLQDDLAVVGEAFGAIAEDGVVRGASALTTSAFIEANENILGYLRNDCLPG